VSRVRVNVYLEREPAKRLAELAKLRRLPKSAIAAAALASFLSSDGADRREAALTRRLDKLQSQSERMGRDQLILIETLALFIRVYLSVSAPIPEGHQEAARAQGKARFQEFITQLGRDLQRGSSFVKTLERDVVPAEAKVSAFEGRAPAGDSAP
jgi:predicted transcriptional regulator